ncbi:MAG: hypothetical protein U1F36_23790 [Planctomycetota bacterium]
MTRTPSPAAALAPARDAIAIALCAVVVYSLCAPRILYGPDAFTFFQMAQQGHATHWMHLLYVPILRLARTLGAPLGIAPFHAFVGASSVSTALGVAFCHRAAARLGADRRRAALTALVVACTPAVAFFAVLLEVQGVFFGAVGLAWLAGASFARRPSTARVVGIGLASGLAAMIHGSGHMLPVCVACIALALADLRGIAFGRLVLWAALGALAHAAVPLTLALTTGLDPLTSVRNSANFVEGSAAGAGGLSHLGTILLDEWVYSFAPFCALIYLAARRRELRRMVLAIHVPLAAYLFVSWSLLGYTFGVHGIEHGAYFLPLAFPLAWATARALPVPVTLTACILSAAIGTWHVRHECDARPRQFESRAVVEALGSNRGLLVVRDAKEGELLSLDEPELALIPFDVIVGGSPRSFEDIVAGIGAQIDGLLVLGRPVAFAASVYEPLLDVHDRFPTWLEGRYRVELREVRGFRCYMVRAAR